MKKVTKLLAMMLLVLGIVGCSQEEQAKPKDEKKNIEPASAETEEADKSNILDTIGGTWMNDEGIITVSTDNKIIVIESEAFSTSIKSELELKEKQDNGLKALLTKVNGEPDDSGVEYQLSINDSNNLIMSVAAGQESKEFPPFIKVTEPDTALDISDEIVGNWANDDAYIRISKRNNNLIMGLRDEHEGIEWENEIEIKGIADKTILGTVVESGGDAKDLGMKMSFTLKDGGLTIKAGSETIELKKTDMERDTWSEEKELAQKQLDFVFYKDDGTEINFADYRGKKVVLLLWGSYVKPSTEMLNHLNDIYAELKQNNIVVYSISNEGNAGEEYIKANNIEVPYLYDLNGDFNLFLGNSLLPTLYVFDEDGYRIENIESIVDKEEMKKQILSQ